MIGNKVSATQYISPYSAFKTTLVTLFSTDLFNSLYFLKHSYIFTWVIFEEKSNLLTLVLPCFLLKDKIYFSISLNCTTFEPNFWSKYCNLQNTEIKNTHSFFILTNEHFTLYQYFVSIKDNVTNKDRKWKKGTKIYCMPLSYTFLQPVWQQIQNFFFHTMLYPEH